MLAAVWADLPGLAVQRPLRKPRAPKTSFLAELSAMYTLIWADVSRPAAQRRSRRRRPPEAGRPEARERRVLRPSPGLLAAAFMALAVAGGGVLGYWAMARDAPEAVFSPTAFVQRGAIDEGGKPIDGVCDFEFSLHNAPVGRHPVRGAVEKTLSVSNGRYASTLDFGLETDGDKGSTAASAFTREKKEARGDGVASESGAQDERDNRGASKRSKLGGDDKRE